MKESNSKPFIPRNKPKSWVVFILACLMSLLVGGPLAILGAWLAVSTIKAIGIALLAGSLAIGIISWLVFMAGTVSGKYKNIQEATWKEQVW